VIVLEHAYHGHTNTLIISALTNSMDQAGAAARPWCMSLRLRTIIAGRNRRGEVQAGARYAAHIGEILDRVRAEGRDVAAFIAETCQRCGAKLCFHRIIGEVYSARCVLPERCALRMKCKWDLGRLGNAFLGNSNPRRGAEIVDWEADRERISVGAV